MEEEDGAAVDDLLGVDGCPVDGEAFCGELWQLVAFIGLLGAAEDPPGFGQSLCVDETLGGPPGVNGCPLEAPPGV